MGVGVGGRWPVQTREESRRVMESAGELLMVMERSAREMICGGGGGEGGGGGGGGGWGGEGGGGGVVGGEGGVWGGDDVGGEGEVELASLRVLSAECWVLSGGVGLEFGGELGFIDGFRLCGA